MNSSAFVYFVSYRTQLAQSFEVGLLKNTPIPEMSPQSEQNLANLSIDLWRAKALEKSGNETSVYFYAPWNLSSTRSNEKLLNSDFNYDIILKKLDQVAFDLWGFNKNDRELATQIGLGGSFPIDEIEGEGKENHEDNDDESIDSIFNGPSWAIGVAFGRFSLDKVGVTRSSVLNASPFDPQPRQCPGSLPEAAVPFHERSGILVDDQGHPHDLPRLIEEVLARVDAEVPGDVRRWLQRDFFPLHLKQYSKSRRRAPIYWPLSTTSGSYTLWLYYPSLTSQTLYTAVNDFIEGPNGKLQQVVRESSALRDKGASRSRDDEKAFEALQTLELELIELRNTLLRIAQTYRPNHDDGVQLTAAPLWPLFRHRPWQTVLKDTWAKLKKGDYDWAHLAMAYWPDRVRENCKTDKSLAIAHDLEHLYVPPEPKAAQPRGRKKASEA